jgi:hypothetical protein
VYLDRLCILQDPEISGNKKMFTWQKKKKKNKTENNVYLREELEHLLLVKSVWNVAQIDDAATLQMQNSQAKIKCKCM